MKKTTNLNLKEKVKVAIRMRPYLDQELPPNQNEEDVVNQDRQMLFIEDSKTINWGK
jgi:hypothetical protein